jgi:hypothetical protein
VGIKARYQERLANLQEGPIMDGLLQDHARRSQLELLVSQQRYEDVMALLSDAIAQNPRDRDACLFRFLVMRIMLLHHALDYYQENLPPLSMRSILRGLARSGRACLRAVCRARAGFTPWVLRIHVGCRVKLPRLLSTDRLQQMLWQLVKGLRAVRYERVFENGKILAVRAQNRLHMARRQRVVFVDSAVGLISIITAVCGVLLAVFASRSPTVAQAPAARAQQVGRPAVSSPDPMSGLETQPRHEKLSSAMDQPSRSLEEVRGDAVHRPVAEKADAETEASKAAQRATSVIKGKKNGRDATSTKPAHNTNRVDNKRPVIVPSKSPAVMRSGEKESPVSVAVTKTSTSYRTRGPIAVREAARFGAPTLGQLAEGVSVAVLNVRNSWAKVLLDGETTGFVRIEFLAPAP